LAPYTAVTNEEIEEIWSLVTALPSCQRRLASITTASGIWIPAFAGMTNIKNIADPP
jgi:hypothetical protein